MSNYLHSSMVRLESNSKNLKNGVHLDLHSSMVRLERINFKELKNDRFNIYIPVWLD